MAANEMVLRHGDPRMIQYTSVAAVPAGEPQPLLGAAAGGGVIVPHGDIPANTPGSYAIGGGVYEMTGNAAIAFGLEVFFDTATRKATVTGTGNRRVGYAVSACTGDGAKFLVYHQPA